MNTAAKLAIGVVALLHVYFMILEMFLWTRPAGLRAFGLKPEQAETSKILAANQGLYNGFVAAGLIWSLMWDEGPHVALFFLTFVIIAGIYGGVTASRKILIVQALPALIALVLMHIR